LKHLVSTPLIIIDGCVSMEENWRELQEMYRVMEKQVYPYMFSGNISILSKLTMKSKAYS
jgi:hypothetical protein